MTLQEIQHKAQSIIHKWRDDDSAPYIEFVDELAHMIVPEPSADLEEAAKEYAKTTFKKPHSDNPDEEVTIVEPDKYAGFIAGVKWDKEQMMSNAVEGTVFGNEVYTWVAGDIPSQFKYGDKVRIIIVKE